MFNITIDEARQLRASYDAEIKRQEESLKLVSFLRDLVAETITQMESKDQDEAHGYGA